MMTAPRTRLSTRRPLLAVVVATLACVLLSSCGLRLSSQLTLDESWKGTRVITATISQEDVKDRLSGGIEAADAAITKHLPSALTYSGISPSGEDYVATFTLSFDSRADYVAKVTELMAASGDGDTPEVTWDHPDSELVSGLHLEESFGDSDLLGWLPEALAVEGVVSDADKSSILSGSSSSEPKVTFAGSEYTSQSTRLSVNTVQDNGVQHAKVVISLRPDSYLSAHVALAFQDSAAAPNLTVLDDYLAQHAPTDSTIDKSVPTGVGHSGRVVSFTSADLTTLNEDLTALLGDMTEPITVETTGLGVDVTAGLTCANVCSPQSSHPLEVVFAVPDNWQVTSADDGSSSPAEQDELLGLAAGNAVHLDNAGSFQASVSLTLLSLTTHVTSSVTGSVTQEVTLAFPTSEIEATGMEAAQAMEAVGVTGATVSEEGDSTLATVKASGDEQKVTKSLEAALPGSSITVSKASGLFSGSYNVSTTLRLPLPSILITEQTQTSAAFDAPFGQDVSVVPSGPEAPETAGKPGSHVESTPEMMSADDSVIVSTTGRYDGIRPAGLIAIGVLVVVIVVCCVLTWVFRKRIAKVLADSRRKNAQAVAQARAAAATANAQLGVSTGSPQPDAAPQSPPTGLAALPTGVPSVTPPGVRTAATPAAYPAAPVVPPTPGTMPPHVTPESENEADFL